MPESPASIAGNGHRACDQCQNMPVVNLLPSQKTPEQNESHSTYNVGPDRKAVIFVAGRRNQIWYGLVKQKQADYGQDEIHYQGQPSFPAEQFKQCERRDRPLGQMTCRS